MYNDILKIGGMTIHGYGLMIAIGVLAAILLAVFRAKRKGLSQDAVYSLALLVMLFGFIGAKLLYVIVDIQAVIADPALIISGNGFVVYGGIIGGVAAMMIYCRVKKYSFLQYFDLVAPSVALAQGFGRIGCLLAGCCYGQETDCACGIIFTHSDIAPNGVRLIPTQPIMSAGDFLIAGALLLYARKDHARGRVGGLYLILYSVGRFAIEFFRADYRGAIGPLSTSQFISIFIFVLGVLLFATDIFRRRPLPVPDPSDDEKPECKKDDASAGESSSDEDDKGE